MVVPLDRLHIRSLQVFLKLGSPSSYTSSFTSSPKLVDSQGKCYERFSLVTTNPSLTLYQGTPLLGCEAYLERKSFSGVCSLA